MIFRLSQKLNAKIKAGALRALPLHENPFADWSAHLFVAGRTQYLLLSNTKSLYSTVMYGKGVTTDSHFIERALGGIREFMEADGQAFVYRRFIVPATASVRFAKALDRSVTGSMNDLIKHATYWLAEGDSRRSTLASGSTKSCMSATAGSGSSLRQATGGVQGAGGRRRVVTGQPGARSRFNPTCTMRGCGCRCQQGSSHSRKCRTMALLRKNEIPHSSKRAGADLAWSRKERVTWVPLAVLLELPRFLELGRQPRKRCGEILHLKPKPVIGLPLHNLLDMTRPVLVRDPDSGADDAGRLDLDTATLMPGSGPKPWKSGHFVRSRICRAISSGARGSVSSGEGDRVHSALSHALSIAASGSGSASR